MRCRFVVALSRSTASHVEMILICFHCVSLLPISAHILLLRLHDLPCGHAHGKQDVFVASPSNARLRKTPFNEPRCRCVVP